MEAFHKVNLDSINKETLDLFQINYYLVDGDWELIMRKFEFQFMKASPIDDIQKDE